MSRFVSSSVERLELGDGDWVDLLTRLNYGERMAVNQELFGAAVRLPGSNGADAPAGADLRAGNIELLRVAIVAWGGPGFCQFEHPHAQNCQPREITAENIAQLDETGERILLELQRRMVPLQSPDFSDTPSPGTGTAAGADPTPGA